MRDRGATKIKKWYRGATKIKKWYRGDSKVWSGGSEVSYYDGNVLLGVREVDEGEDVLRPNINMTKVDYTHVGWALSEGGAKVLELVATGEPMTLYAIYLPNSINVVGNSRYISGSTYTSNSHTPAYEGGQSLDSSTSFTLNMHEYQNNSVTVVCQALYSDHIDNDQPSGNGKFDSSIVPKNGSSTFTNIANGTHIVRTEGHTANEGEARNTQTLRCYVSSLVLSNPTKWV